MPGAFSAVIQCFFHDAIISLAMNYSAAIQHWSAYAYSLAMPATFSAAMERSVRFHLLCLLPSRRHAISCAMPVALSAALELLMRLSFAALSAKVLCGFAGPCFLGPASRGHSCRIFLGMPRRAGIPVSPAVPGLSYSGVGWVCIEPAALLCLCWNLCLTHLDVLQASSLPSYSAAGCPFCGISMRGSAL